MSACWGCAGVGCASAPATGSSPAGSSAGSFRSPVGPGGLAVRRDVPAEPPDGSATSGGPDDEVPATGAARRPDPEPRDGDDAAAARHPSDDVTADERAVQAPDRDAATSEEDASAPSDEPPIGDAEPVPVGDEGSVAEDEPEPVAITGDLDVLCRDALGLAAAGAAVRRQTIDTLTLHHTEVLLERNALAPQRLRRHQRFHQDQGWPDIAYHFAVDLRGNVYELRDPASAGDTFTSYDPAGHLLVVCEGDFNHQQPTDALLAAVAALFASASATYGVPLDRIAARVADGSQRSRRRHDQVPRPTTSPGDEHRRRGGAAREREGIMTGAITPGWYPDPTGAGQERWWDGTSWTRTTRPRPAVGYVQPVAGDGDATQHLPPVSVGEDGRQSRRWWILTAAVLLPVLAGGVVWGVLTLLPGATAEPDADPLASGALVVDDQPTERETEPPPVDEVVTDPAEEEADPTEEPEPLPPPEPQLDPEVGEPPSGPREGDDASGPSDGDADDGTAADDDDRSSSSEAQPQQRTVDLDGQCTVTLDADLVDGGQPIRAWNHPGCQWAPIGLGPGEQLWIVVVTSLNGEAHGAVSAVERADEYGYPGNVLWSSHHPSLNPGVWAIYAGPYRTEDDAKEATRRIGGRAYPRVLSEDPGDRYCTGADNCEGERD